MGFRGGQNKTSGTRTHSGTLSISGSLRGHTIHLIHGACDLDQSAARWLPMGYGLGESSAANYTTRFVCPANGRLKRTVIRCKAAAGASSLALYRAIDGTNAAATLVETVGVAIASVDTSYDFDFSGSLHFQKGNVISFRLNPTSNPDETNFTHVLELFTRTAITGS